MERQAEPVPVRIDRAQDQLVGHHRRHVAAGAQQPTDIDVRHHPVTDQYLWSYQLVRASRVEETQASPFSGHDVGSPPFRARCKERCVPESASRARDAMKPHRNGGPAVTTVTDSFADEIRKRIEKNRGVKKRLVINRTGSLIPNSRWRKTETV